MKTMNKIGLICYAAFTTLSINTQKVYGQQLTYQDLITWSTLAAYRNACSYDQNFYMLLEAYGYDVKSSLKGISEVRLEEGFKTGIEIAEEAYIEKIRQYGEVAGEELFCIDGKRIFSTKVLPYLRERAGG